ncbi:hypothetical protein Pnap_3150 [Polaromonas naphthalenivorans CJ2]|uniref:Uncharacterized protein n=1 Tax=Polaromonas naphthalenivorans (strain CJ2) TaxID=365044 RepID=A1VS20_POLNA|nr:hypothetical protein Pnap_3150 [Polaromonas naphthalenivorans CJ2]
MAEEIELEVRGAGVRQVQSKGCNAVERSVFPCIFKGQECCPVAKTAAITLDRLEQTHKTVTQSSLYADGGLSALRANDFSFARGCRQVSHHWFSRETPAFRPGR